MTPYLTGLIDYMEAEAERIIQECVDEREYTHRTMNLKDSYGYGIYLKNRLVRMGFLTKAKEAETPKSEFGGFGRDVVTEFLKSKYKPNPGIDMVIVAAMPYAYDLENATGGVRHKYRVISMSYDKLKNLSAKMNIKGTKVYNRLDNG